MKIFKVILILLLFIYTFVMCYQIFVSNLNPGQRDTTQEELLLISNRWFEKHPNKNVQKFAAAVGKSFLSCRYWAFDYFRDNCYELIIYVDKMPEQKWINDLQNLLSEPCNFKDDLSDLREEFNIGKTMICSNRKCNFRLGLSFETFETTKFSSGAVKNEFHRIHSLIFEGNRPCLS